MKTKVFFLFWLVYVVFCQFLLGQENPQFNFLGLNDNNCKSVKFQLTFEVGDNDFVHDNEFEVFWSFGDGNYNRNVYDADSISNIEIDYDYLGLPAPNNIYIEITRLSYDDVIPPPRIFLSNSPSWENIFVDCDFEADNTFNSFDSSETISITSNRSPVFGHNITYIISYNSHQNRKCQGAIDFSFGSDYLENKIVEGPIENFLSSSDKNETLNAIRYYLNNNVLNVDSMPIQLSDSGLRWMIDKDEIGRIFIPLSVKEDALGGSVETRVDYTNIGDCSDRFDTIHLNDPIGESHDPNDIISYSNYSCDFKQSSKTITYRIRFQNDGSAPVDTVKIKNYIPNVYLLESFKHIHPPLPDSTDFNFYSIDFDTREVQWTLPEDILRYGDPMHGTQHEDFGNLFDYDDTHDSVVYSVQLIEPEFKYCDAVVNVAEIIFDKNDPIITEPHFLRYQCCQFPVDIKKSECNGCSFCDEIYISDRAPIELVRNETVTLSDPNNFGLSSVDENLEVRWYPEVYLVDDGDANQLPYDRRLFPTIRPESDIDYFLVVSNIYKRCNRKIIKVPVRIVDGEQNIYDNIFYRMGIIGVILLGGIVVFILIRRSNG